MGLGREVHDAERLDVKIARSSVWLNVIRLRSGGAATKASSRPSGRTMGAAVVPTSIGCCRELPPQWAKRPSAEGRRRRNRRARPSRWSHRGRAARERSRLTGPPPEDGNPVDSGRQGVGDLDRDGHVGLGPGGAVGQREGGGGVDGLRRDAGAEEAKQEQDKISREPSASGALLMQAPLRRPRGVSRCGWRRQGSRPGRCSRAGVCGGSPSKISLIWPRPASSIDSRRPSSSCIARPRALAGRPRPSRHQHMVRGATATRCPGDRWRRVRPARRRTGRDRRGRRARGSGGRAA